MYIHRILENEIIAGLENSPIVALLGPRQCGKSTLAKKILEQFPNSIYLDLEKISDRNKLHEPELFFAQNVDRLICLDEIQRMPEFFSILRSIVDERGSNGQFLILGSASPKLIRQSSESLAGRVFYLELTPFHLSEIAAQDINTLWNRGGFPRSFLAKNVSVSFQWRQNFVRTFLERDIPQLGFRIPAGQIERFWMMCAHSHGQLLNKSKIGASLGVSQNTVQSYIDILENAYMLRVLKPFETNLKKRLIKAPKIFIRDTGILNTLLTITDYNELLGHPVFGSSWEGFIIENILNQNMHWQSSFYRDSNGSEIDLILQRANRRIAVECKASTAPTISRAFYNAIELLNISEAFIVAPVKDAYHLSRKVQVMPLADIIVYLKK